MDFSKEFLWGAASAAYQIEGAYQDDGKGPGIWDALSEGHIAHGENGNIACDHYHRFREDVALMKKIGLKSYRFSISWPRILPEGIGKVNEAGLQFYSDLVDALLEANIEPMVTLYHWNLPMKLYERGGWQNADSPEWFAEYVGVIAKALAGRVKYWITFNEPQIFVGAGLVFGNHAPFTHISGAEVTNVMRNLLLAHGKAVSVLRRECSAQVRIGIAPSADTVIPHAETPEAIEEARKATFALNPDVPIFCIACFCISWFCDPILLGDYLPEDKERMGNKLPQFTAAELESISQPLDFMGFNVYQGGGNPFPQNPNTYDRYSYQGSPRTACNWNITPDVMYWCCRFFFERYKKPLMVTENGIACFDSVSLDGAVHDPNRKDYIHRHLLSLHRAIDEGIPVLGYQYWSIMDNLEWTDGYDKRFGLIYVDYRTQQRIVKDSAWWYSEVIRTNGKELK